MAFLFESFEGWKKYSEEHKRSLVDVVLEYEMEQRGTAEAPAVSATQRHHGNVLPLHHGIGLDGQ